MVADNIVADAYWLRVIFADDIADDITFGYLTFRSLFYSFWCRFRTWWSFRRTSIIRRIRRRLVCFSPNLHVTGFSSCRITTMIHSYLVCVCTICIDVKLLIIAGACGTHVLPRAMKLWAWVGRETWPVCCTCSYMYMYSPAPGRIEVAAGGHLYSIAVDLYCHCLLWL